MNSPQKDPLTWMFPPIQPYEAGKLKVSGGHELYFEQCGNPNGKPIVVIHGGPGGGCSEKMRRFFDPRAYRVILFDQRGAGKSTPHACLENNTTWDLVEDIERLKNHLNVSKWHVFGGSWGSTLALAYAETHPTSVTALVLRGIFLLRHKEIQWFYQEGASYIFPDVWEMYWSHIPENERSDMVKAYHKRLTSEDLEVSLEAAKRWSLWEGATSRLFPDVELMNQFEKDEFATALARIECHYFVNRGFFDTDDQLLRNVEKIRHIPAAIVQGRYDVVCPMDSAWELHKRWPESDLIIVPDAGHSAYEPGISKALVSATEKFANL